METLDPALLTDMCVHFIEKLQSNGYFCGIYVNDYWLNRLLDTEKITTNFDVWYARCEEGNTGEWDLSWGDLPAMWQYSRTGRIGEHEYNFDLDLVFKDYPSLIKKWGYNGFEPIPSENIKNT